MRVVFVHGACVKDGSWWWRRTADLLQERGVRSVSPLLPSCGEGGSGGFAEDVAAVRGVLQDSDEPTVVVAHSYGGIVTAQAAAGIGPVRHLLLISSYLPEVGQGLADFGGGPSPFLDVDVDAGTFGVRPELLVDTFLHDCDPEVRAEGERHLARQNVEVTSATVTAAAWQALPTTYLVCAQDRGTPPRRQREHAARADTVVEIDAGHHPFLSRPAEVRDLVLRLAPRS